MFYEKRTKRAWFSSTSSEVCWEQWAITINVVTNINDKGTFFGSTVPPNLFSISVSGNIPQTGEISL
jgi:hypothetical protein